jgi:DHA1 family bicyclomycin/chloramphenicol resistance-like MFS transporter
MQKKSTAQLEFIIIMASLMSLVALSIDAVLPALNNIALDINSTNATDTQLLITMIFLGLGSGQLIAGPLSDSLGRKPVVYGGFLIFAFASIICVYAQSLEIMVFGRILQGIGLSAPRTLSIAMVRDTYEGDYMAKIMSFIVSLFIIIPVIAPTLGKLMLDNFGWESIFTSQLIFGFLVVLWFRFRQPETLKPVYKKPFRLSIFKNGFLEFFKHNDAIIYTVISGFITGSFMVFLGTSQQIFQEQYKLVDEFPYLFGAIALAVGFATFINGTVVVKFGMKKLVRFFLVLFTAVSLFYVVVFYQQANPPIVVLVISFMIQFFAIGFLFGNLRSLAMQPIGHIAGVGAAINGFLSTVMAVPIASFIGLYVIETTYPLFVGFLFFGTASILLLFLTRNKVD